MPEPSARPVEQAMAHYHRLLGELLTALVEDAEVGEARVVWLDGEERHVIRKVGQNEYARAVYLLEDLGRYREALYGLARVQDEVERLSALTGGRGEALVTPVVRTGVRHVRLNRDLQHVGQTLTGAAARGWLAQARDRLLRDLEAERAYGLNPATEALAEVERALEALRDVEAVRVRWRYPRWRANLYPLDIDGDTERVYVTKPGLIAAGPGIGLTRPTGPRKPRSDRVTLPPLAEVQGRQYYDLQEFIAARDEARERARAKRRRR